MSERFYINDKCKILRYENNLVTLIRDGEKFEPLEPRRLFPVSSLNTYITLLDKDGTEIAIIRSLDDLDKDSREIINESLIDYYLVPTITRIIDVHEKYGTLRWTVETDRGIKTFDIRNRNHDIKVYPDGRVRVRDADDNRYVIDDYRALDQKSRKNMLADL